MIGLNGPVGAGKTSLAQQLQRQFAATGLKLAVASIDDAYRPWPERCARLAGNPFGVHRVPPGSHDPERLLAAIASWRSARCLADGSAPLQLPRFDKTLRDGEGDPTTPWQGSAHALLLEGWLVGCRPLQAAEGEWINRCNQALEDYQPLWRSLSQLMVLWPAHWGLPRRWRFQAEAKQRRGGGGWLSPQALDDLVRASLESLPPDLYQRPVLQRADWARVLDGRRRCLWEGSGAAAAQLLAASGSHHWPRVSAESA